MDASTVAPSCSRARRAGARRLGIGQQVSASCADTRAAGVFEAVRQVG